MPHLSLVASMGSGREFTAVAAIEDRETREGDVTRTIKRFYTDSLPVPLLDGHDRDNMSVVGRVDKFYRLSEASEEIRDRAIKESGELQDVDHSRVWIAEGVFDTSDNAAELESKVSERMLRGVSVGAGKTSEPLIDAAGNIVWDEWQVVEVSLASVQAIGGAVMWLNDTFVEADDSLVASVDRGNVLNGAPIKPPKHWFTLEGIPEKLPPHPVVTEAGRVYALGGLFNRPVQYGSGTVEMPHEPDYSYFHTHGLTCEDGEIIRVGGVSMDTSHAALSLGGMETQRHYDHTGTTVADVRAIKRGNELILTGALRPDLDELGIRKFQGTALSGDWRPERGQRRLRWMLCVNSPRFAAVEDREPDFESQDNRELALVASFTDEDKTSDTGNVTMLDKVKQLSQDVAKLRGEQIISVLREKQKK